MATFAYPPRNTGNPYQPSRSGSTDQTGIAPAANWPGSAGSMRSISWWVTPDVTAYVRQKAADPYPDRDHDTIEPGALAVVQGYVDAPGPLLHARDVGFLANRPRPLPRPGGT